VDTVERLAELLVERQPAVALTGAGVSTESGIPDFRSRDGLWAQLDPLEYGSIDAFRADPGKVWRFYAPRFAMLTEAAPNAAHIALAELERRALLRSVITQNIDLLHQRAGSRDVVEVHGSIATSTCGHCGARFELERVVRAIETGGGVPRCDACGAVLKPDVVFFGELLPRQAFERAVALARDAALLLVVGSSLEVYPVAGLPRETLDAGSAGTRRARPRTARRSVAGARGSSLLCARAGAACRSSVLSQGRDRSPPLRRPNGGEVVSIGLLALSRRADRWPRLPSGRRSTLPANSRERRWRWPEGICSRGSRTRARRRSRSSARHRAPSASPARWAGCATAWMSSRSGSAGSRSSSAASRRSKRAWPSRPPNARRAPRRPRSRPHRGRRRPGRRGSRAPAANRPDPARPARPAPTAPAKTL